MSLLDVLLEDPGKLVNRALSNLYRERLRLHPRIEFGPGLKLDGVPLIDIRRGSRLTIGDSVTLTSRNRGYHLNLHSPVKLFADREGAVIRIGNGSRIHGSCVHAYELVEIGERVLIAANCQIIDASGHDASFENVENRIHTRGSSAPVRIEDDVWIGTGAIVLPGVTIGKGSIVGAGSVVTHDIPPLSLAGGVPAKVSAA